MRSVGIPELVVVLVLILSVLAMGTAVWFFASRGRKFSAVASRICGSCGQRVPDLGNFCPMCGRDFTLPQRRSSDRAH